MNMHLHKLSSVFLCIYATHLETLGPVDRSERPENPQYPKYLHHIDSAIAEKLHKNTYIFLEISITNNRTTKNNHTERDTLICMLYKLRIAILLSHLLLQITALLSLFSGYQLLPDRIHVNTRPLPQWLSPTRCYAKVEIA